MKVSNPPAIALAPTKSASTPDLSSAPPLLSPMPSARAATTVGNPVVHRPGMRTAGAWLTGIGAASVAGVMLTTLGLGLSADPQSHLPVMLLSVFGSLGTMGAGLGLEHLSRQPVAAKSPDSPLA